MFGTHYSLTYIGVPVSTIEILKDYIWDTDKITVNTEMIFKLTRLILNSRIGSIIAFI
jgi:hypothetical protein